MKSKKEMLENQEEFFKTYEKARTQLMQIPGVIGVGVGLKEKDGKVTEDISLQVYVQQKKSESSLPADQIIPKEIEGIPTDVLLVGETTSSGCNNQTRYSSVRGGIQITNNKPQAADPTKIDVGTLGCVGTLNNSTERDKYVLLSNNHVIYANGAAENDLIYQPNRNVNTAFEGAIGKIMDLHFEQDVTYPDGGPNSYFIDCARAKILTDFSSCCCNCNKGVGFDNEITELNVNAVNTISNHRDVISDLTIIGQQVFKVGRTTGRTVGKVTSISGPHTHNGNAINNIIKIQFDTSVTATNCEGQARFSNKGDSGSAIIDGQNRIIGLLFGDNTNVPGLPEADYYTVACHIMPVLTKLAISINYTATPSGGSGGTGGSSGSADSSAVSKEAFASTFTTETDTALPAFATLETLHDLEQKLMSAPKTKAIYTAIQEHRREVVHLVNHNRAVMTTWHRFQGPGYLTSFLNNAKDDSLTIPEKIKDISLQTLLIKMADVLKENGSKPLREAIEKYAIDIISVADECRTLDDFRSKINNPVLL